MDVQNETSVTLFKTPYHLRGLAIHQDPTAFALLQLFHTEVVQPLIQQTRLPFQSFDAQFQVMTEHSQATSKLINQKMRDASL